MSQARNVGATFTVNNGGTSNTAPFGYLDKGPYATKSGAILASGWVLDREDITLTVELLLDGQSVSSNPTRGARADVCTHYSAIGTCSSSQPGFSFNLNTATVVDGNHHTLAVRVTDPGGLAMVLGGTEAQVANNGGGLGSAIVSEAMKFNGYVGDANYCNMFSLAVVPPAAAVCEEWCADFAKYVWRQVGADTSGLDATTLSFYRYGSANGTWKQGADNPNVAPGDAVVYASGNKPGQGQHVGIVMAVNDNGTLDVINGDWGVPDVNPVSRNVVIRNINPRSDTVAHVPILGYTSAVK
jgi:hypothetical protein